jgi:uncharacterized membrane protein YkvA (DUF1232 family)
MPSGASGFAEAMGKGLPSGLAPPPVCLIGARMACSPIARTYIRGMMNTIHNAGYLVPKATDEPIVRRRFWDKIRSTLGRIPFTEQAIAAFYSATDRKTPPHVKAMLFAALAYFVLPIDVIPDFIAALGFTDDATVILATISALAPYVTEAHYQRARAFLAKDGS